MPELKDLDVHTVSFVDKAAVRDPANPGEPMRFLLWKSEGAVIEKDQPTPADVHVESLVAAEDEEKKLIRAMSSGSPSRADQLAYLQLVSPQAAASYKRQQNPDRRR
jgi:hypothetical protein